MPHLPGAEFTIPGLSGPWSVTTPSEFSRFVELFGAYNSGFLQEDELGIT